MDILYDCTSCDASQLIDEGIHNSAWHYVECDCGEKMLPANQNDLETMDIYDEYEA